ncbi:component of SufBCD complex [Maritimibacter sp. 55A14]|uniref:component of SufBCD complex n=1 Tax=Maritimibacter sp. 55A14 TaxID=2174844 RepID=UPI000D60B82B|nr:component of SufBCD complex [Maritimibacter sp. 55A14]PWE33160.1 component of SufBCD complex [Maritimibacter sp. 55A14]
MDFYARVFELIDMRSFSNLWYWIMLAVVWSTASHWVIGVPFDMVARARRHGGQAAHDVEAMVAINVGRLTYIADTAGLWLMALGTFLLAGLATMGFGYSVEFCQALFLIAAPMSLVGLLSIRFARRLQRETPEGDLLYALLRRHRLVTQVIGMFSIFVTAFWGMWHNMATSILGG